MAAIYLAPATRFTPEMLVGALVDLGAKPSALEWELSKLELPDYHLHFERIGQDSGTGVAFSIHAGAIHHDHHHDHDEVESSEEHAHHHHGDSDSNLGIDQLQRLIQTGELSPFVKGCLDSALASRTADGASAIALETLVPNALVAICLEQLGVERIFSESGSQSAELPQWLRQIAPELCAQAAAVPPNARTGVGVGEGETRLTCRLA
jgi:hypothetical protein